MKQLVTYNFRKTNNILKAIKFFVVKIILDWWKVSNQLATQPTISLYLIIMFFEVSKKLDTIVVIILLYFCTQKFFMLALQK